MKIKLGLYIDNKFVVQDLHEDFAGVTTYETKRGGEFRVKEINSLSFDYSGDLIVYAHPLDRDVPVKEPVEAPAIEPPVAYEEVSVESPF